MKIRHRTYRRSFCSRIPISIIETALAWNNFNSHHTHVEIFTRKYNKISEESACSFTLATDVWMFGDDRNQTVCTNAKGPPAVSANYFNFCISIWFVCCFDVLYSIHVYVLNMILEYINYSEGLTNSDGILTFSHMRYYSSYQSICWVWNLFSFLLKKKILNAKCRHEMKTLLSPL